MAIPPSTPDDMFSNQESGIDSERLQIRVVPYSPPRFNFEEVASPRRASHPDGALSSPSHSTSSRPHNPYDPFASPRQEILTGRDQRDLTGNDSDGQAVAEYVDAATSAPNWTATSGSSVPSSPSSSYRRPRRVITVNSDKTFSLVAQEHLSTSARGGFRTPRRSSTTPSSSVDPSTPDPLPEVPSGSPLTTLGEFTPSPSSSCSRLSSELSSSPIAAAASSPWNYKSTGGLRKVPEGSGRSYGQEVSDGSTPAAPVLRSAVSGSQLTYVAAEGKSPIAQRLSHSSRSTLSESLNFKTFYGSSPRPAEEYHFSSDAGSLGNSGRSHADYNFEIIGESSSSELSMNEEVRPDSDHNHDENYVLHSDRQPSSPGFLPSSSHPKEKYSNESLIVAPLRPADKPFKDRFQSTTQRAATSRSTASTTSLPSTAIEEGSRTFFAGTSTVFVPGSFRERLFRRSMSFAALGGRHLRATPLSTVCSESERSSQVPSLSLSRSTYDNSRSASYAYCLNPSLSLLANLDQNLEACLDTPQPINGRVWSREANTHSTRLIENQDEHGDGLAELEEMHRRPSRPGLHCYLSSCPSDISVRSSSTRSNSFSHSYIPTWAR